MPLGLIGDRERTPDQVCLKSNRVAMILAPAAVASSFTVLRATVAAAGESAGRPALTATFKHPADFSEANTPANDRSVHRNVEDQPAIFVVNSEIAVARFQHE